MDQPEVRVTVPGYQDLVRVGSGGFSMVYRAHQSAFDRTVAVKVLTVELVDEQAQRRFQRECRASGRLSNHPNIVTVLDSGFTDDGRPFITTEYMSHGSLADRLEQDGPYPLADVLQIGVLMCGALAAVHAAGILHRDIKPQNILVSDYGEPALADFGISAITVGPEASIGTSSITPLHVAPEVLEGQPTSPASDVYSLGSTLYMLLAGHAPFQRDDDDALLPLMRRVVMDPVPDIERDDVPGAVNDLLRYAMAKQPFARYATALAFGEAIQATQAHLGLPVTPLRTPGPARRDAADDDTVEPGAMPPVPPSGEIVEPAWAAGSAGAAGVAAADGPDPAAATPASTGPSSTGPSSTGPSAAAPGSSSRARVGLLVAVAVIAVVALIGAGLALRARNADPVTAAGPTAATGGAPSTTGATSGDGSGDPTDPSTPTGIPAVPPTPGLRFDVEGGGLDVIAPNEGGVLRLATDGEPASWNPAQSRFSDGAMLVATAVFDPLTVLTGKGPEPYLATALTPNATFDEWTIELPTGVTFHDGSPLDAAAVKANFDRRLANDLMSRPLAPVQAVRVDGTKVVVTTRQPWPALPVTLAGESGLVASPATLTSEAGAKPVGTGPFSFSSAEPGKKIQLVKNTDYWRKGRPFLDGIDVSLVDTNTARRSAFDAGQVDVVRLTDPKAVDELSSSTGVLQARQANVATVILNTTSAPLDDVRVRQALAAAVDRSAVTDALFGGKAPVAGAFLPPDSPWADGTVGKQSTDPDAARAKVAAVGAPVSLTLTIGPAASQRTLAETLQAQWRDVGIDVSIVTKSGDDELTAIVDGTYQLALWTYSVPTDPDESYVWFHTDATPGAFTYNLPRFSNPTVDRGYDTGRRQAALADRKAAYVEVGKGLVEQVPAIFLVYLPDALVAAPQVSGWKVPTVGGVGRGGTPWATDIGFK